MRRILHRRKFSPPPHSGRWNDTRLWHYLGDPRGRVCGYPNYWPLTSRSLPIFLAKAPHILGISGTGVLSLKG